MELRNVEQRNRLFQQFLTILNGMYCRSKGQAHPAAGFSQAERARLAVCTAPCNQGKATMCAEHKR
jgi:hypothetical protein